MCISQSPGGSKWYLQSLTEESLMEGLLIQVLAGLMNQTLHG